MQMYHLFSNIKMRAREKSNISKYWAEYLDRKG